MAILSFSKYARSYDQYATVQQHVFQKLACELASYRLQPTRILDIGCGTGTHTAALLTQYPQAQIRGIDLAPYMIEHAKNNYGHLNIDFAIEDAQGLSETQAYDLVLSSSTLQWVQDLSGAFGKIRARLTPQGRCFITMFGPQTFWELQQCLTTILGRPAMVAATAFRSPQEIYTLANGYFSKLQFRQELIRKTYPSLVDLLKYIKFTGSNPLGNTRLWTPRLLEEIERLYVASYRGIRATYQIVYFSGER